MARLRGYKLRTPEEQEADDQRIVDLWTEKTTIDQAAERLGMPRGSVSVYVSRLRKQKLLPQATRGVRPAGREDQIAALLRKGSDVRAIADACGIAVETAYKTVRMVRRKDPLLPRLERTVAPSLRSGSFAHKVAEVLRVATEGRAPTTAAIARQLGIPRKRVSVLVCRLRKRGLLPREPARTQPAKKRKKRG